MTRLALDAVVRDHVRGLDTTSHGAAKGHQPLEPMLAAEPLVAEGLEIHLQLP